MARFLILFSTGLLLLPVGCQTNAGQAAEDAVDWVRSALRVYENHSIEAVNTAVEQAGKALELQPVSQEKDQVTGEFVYKNAADDKITITTEKLGDKRTELRIQVGLMGNKQQSGIILDKIRSYL